MSPFEFRQRVLYADTDQMGVVYHANYLRFFETGRSELMRAQGYPYQALERDGFMLPVVEAVAHYKLPARYDDILLIRTRLTDVRRASFAFEYEICRDSDGKLLCTGKTLHACVARDGRPTKLPPALSAIIARLTATA
jgi:acyl-CoA thioester hydrolase